MMGDELRLRALYEELRRLKQEELPRKKDNPVDQARHDMDVRARIERAEREIEEEMRRDG